MHYSTDFVRLVGISPDKLYALAKHYKTNGLVPRQLRAGGGKNNTASHALVDTECAVHRSPCCELAWTSFWLQKRHLLAAFIMSKESSLPSL